MEYIIRVAQEEDMPQVRALIQELAVYENEPDAVEISVEDLVRDGFGTSPLFHCFVAANDMELLGIALVYPRYSTWKGKTIHLEDLVVRQKYRGLGVGGALLDEVVRYGNKLGVKRIEWAVLDWNESAIDFYEKKGAVVMRDWDVVQLDENGIAAYIDKLKS